MAPCLYSQTDQIWELETIQTISHLSILLRVDNGQGSTFTDGDHNDHINISDDAIFQPTGDSTNNNYEKQLIQSISHKYYLFEKSNPISSYGICPLKYQCARDKVTSYKPWKTCGRDKDNSTIFFRKQSDDEESMLVKFKRQQFPICPASRFLFTKPKDRL